MLVRATADHGGRCGISRAHGSLRRYHHVAGGIKANFAERAKRLAYGRPNRPDGHAQLKFGATVASVAVGGAWAALAKEAAIPSWMAYSGAGATSAGANAAAQYLTTGTVSAPDVIFAGATGTFGGWAVRLPDWQAPAAMMVNTGGAAVNTMVDNAVYGENESVGRSIFTSGLGTSFGYGATRQMTMFNP